MRPIEPPSLQEIEAARERIRGLAFRTPLVRLGWDEGPAEIHLKLENLQPIGSFKIRGAGNAMSLLPPEKLGRGVYTASAGNMAQGVAYAARRMGVSCTVVVPEHAPQAKRAAIERLGARAVPVPFDDWWRVMEEHRFPGLDAHFIHPFADRDVIAGHGTIGLEILEDLPDVDAVLVPYGGGGLSSGIAAALHALRPGVSVYGCEVETAAPLRVSLEAGAPRVVDRVPSFVDGIGGKSLFPEMWPMVRELLRGSLVVSVVEAARAVRLLVERCHVVAEGAGAVPVAAAIRGIAGPGGLGGARRLVCVVSGGNIDASCLGTILAGGIP